MLLKVLHVIEGIQESCGISRFVIETVRELRFLGADAVIATTKNWNVPADDLVLFQTQFPEAAATDFKPDLVHLHGCWNRYIHRVAVWCRRNDVPYFLSPHGAWTPWAMEFHAWKKRIAWWLYQKTDAQRAVCFHVTVASETEDVKRLGFSQEVVVAPLGIHVKDHDNETSQGLLDEKILLYLGRLHFKKNVHGLLKVWQRLPKEIKTGWKLVIAGKTGPDNPEYLQQLQELADSDCEFVGEVVGNEKEVLYSRASLYILPSFSENFGVVVLEALAAGTPVITTSGTPWQSLPEVGCGWWVDPSEDTLLEVLTEAMSQPEYTLRRMGEAGGEHVREAYSWRHTAELLKEAYSKVFEPTWMH